jgi:CheY-like chemotaxis protein
MDNTLLKGKRVLVIEDEMLVAMGLQDLLSDLGCDLIAVAADVEKALGLIAVNTFDLATLDLNLNGTLSYAIAEALESRHIPFAFSTGYSEHGINESYRERPVLKKPFSRSRFEKVISELLGDGLPPALAA